MKKLICLLALCLCLNGALAAAEGGAPEPEPAVTEQSSDASGENQPEKSADESGKGQDSEPAPPQEAAPQSEQASQPEAAAQGEGDSRQETQAQAEDEAPQSIQAQPEAQPKPEAENHVEGEGQQDAQPQPEAENHVEGEGQQDAQSQPEDESRQQTDEQHEAAPQNGDEAQGGPQAQTEAEPVNEGEPHQGEQPQPEAAPQGETEAPQEQQDQTEQAESSGIPEDAEAWFERDGQRTGGKLADIVALLQGDEKVYLRSDKLMCVPDAPLKKLSGVTLHPDKQAFAGKDCSVRVSLEDPRDVGEPAIIALSELSDRDGEARAALYIWVGENEKTPEEAAAEPVPAISVTATGFTPAEWSRETPVFTLSGIPEGAKYSYAAIIYDERIIPLSGDSWTAEQEGVYTARFAMLDGIGDIVSASERYTLWLDHTEPEIVIIMPDEEVSYTLHIIARDSVSGVAGVSLDGGATWSELADDESFTYTANHKQTFDEGSIQVADHAGNTYVFAGTITLEKATPAPYPGGGGGGGGGTTKAAKTHASGDGEDTAQYDALTLELPDGPMTRLTVGGEAMDLTLTLESASGVHVGEAKSFTASLGRWGAAGDADGAPDTLILNAEPDAGLGDQYTYEWRFNGEVYRMLANSDIKYVALRVGDDVVAFPTDGFTGGTKYTELKMLGVSTRRFDYTIDMKVNRSPGYMSAMSDSDYSRACDLSIRTEVENMAYELSSSTGSIMYFYDVYLGPKDMLSQPFGKYKG